MTPELRRIIRFLLVGMLNTGFGYLCYSALVLAGVSLAFSVAATTIMGLLFNFLSYGGLVFGSIQRRLLPRFMTFYVALGGLNFVLLQGLAWSGLGPLSAQALLLPVLAAIGYFCMHRFVFRGLSSGPCA